jgi:ribonuclease HII
MFNLKFKITMNKKLINGGAVGNRIVEGFLFVILLTVGACNGQGSNSRPNLTPSGIDLKAYEATVEKMGGWGPCEGDCLLAQAAVESRKVKEKNKLDEAKTLEEVKYYKLVEKVNGKNLLEALTQEKVLEETKKGQEKGKKPKRALVLKEGISGYYKLFVEAVLSDQPNSKLSRHAKLMVLVEGLRFVSAMTKQKNLDNDQAANKLVQGFEAKINEAEAGVYAKVLKDETAWPSIEFVAVQSEAKFNTEEKKKYKLGPASVKAAKEFLDKVKLARSEYQKANQVAVDR